MSTDLHSPTLLGSLQRTLTSSMGEMNVAIPGRVTEYDPTEQRATVQPLIDLGFRTEKDDRDCEARPPVTEVPILFQGAGGMRITFPVQPGDLVLLIFSHASLDLWLANDGRQVDPGDDRTHHASDAIAIPGIATFKSAPGANGSAMVLEGSDIRLGSANANDPVALKSDVDAIQAALDGHEHTYVPGTGTPTTTTSNPSVPAPVGAEKVTAE